MDVYPMRMTAAHHRFVREMGEGNASEYVRSLIEADMDGYKNRRKGPKDRRRK